MAGQLLDSHPELAHRHAQEARRMAGRVAVVREAAGQAAYVAGHYAEALSELRAARRLNGSVAFLPMMADAERGLGKPARALELAADPAAAELDSAGKAELLIVRAGAERDLGDLDAALGTLQVKALDSQRRVGWVARLRYAYADLLLEAGREQDAVEWFTRSAEADVDGETDADDRLAELAGLTVLAVEDEEDLDSLDRLDAIPSDELEPGAPVGEGDTTRDTDDDVTSETDDVTSATDDVTGEVHADVTSDTADVTSETDDVTAGVYADVTSDTVAPAHEPAVSAAGDETPSSED